MIPLGFLDATLGLVMEIRGGRWIFPRLFGFALVLLLVVERCSPLVFGVQFTVRGLCVTLARGLLNNSVDCSTRGDLRMANELHNRGFVDANEIPLTQVSVG